MGSFKFINGPDDMVAELRYYSRPDEEGQSSYIAFSGKGPRGGYVYGPSSIHERYMNQLDDMIADAKGWPFRCKGCGRAEEDCSADPCADVDKKKIWCLFSVSDDYDQPNNNLVTWWQVKPSIETLAAFLAKPLDKADDEDIAKIVDIWRGKSAGLGFAGSLTQYRLEEVEESKHLGEGL